jgi:phage terminase large subunit-like protein
MMAAIEEHDLAGPRLSEYRRQATKDDPLCWALTYLPHHLQLDDGTISLSDIQAEWFDHADDPGRHVYVAPRGSGKSTIHFLVIPLWLAATGRRRFIAAFSESATQAELHLSTLKVELARNARLREDYPELCRAGKMPGGGNVADNQGLRVSANGFAFAARGIDASSLGLKVGDQRPDHLLFDDIEPHASAYSAYQVGKRLATVTDAVLPMGSQTCSATIVGTVTMTGSIIHQAVRHPQPEDPNDGKWIDEEGFEVHHALPFDEQGGSVWPERWSTEYLRGIEHTRSFRLNFLNQPAALDGEYWEESDYRYGAPAGTSRLIVAVDPAVTTAKSSDETGIAVVGYSSAQRKACVYEAFGVRLKGEPLRARLLDVLGRYPEIAEILWERNAGGEMMAGSVLHDMPVRVTTVHNSEKKEVRMERALSYYRRGAVLHAKKLPALEAQQMEFPRGLHDDVADSVSMALDHLAAPTKRPLRAASR